MDQVKQREWHDQWTLLADNEEFLFRDWIYPVTLEEFLGKSVLECGCGGGQHTRFISAYAASVTAVDLNTVDIARQHNCNLRNISFVEADIATMDLGCTFEIVFSIGVVHHTDDPDKTIENLKKHVMPGGKLIVWVYSKEGNGLVRCIVEPIRRIALRDMPRKALLGLSRIVTAAMYVPIYTAYLLPLHFLPFYEYFRNFRKLGFNRNVLNVYDKLSAPQVEFIDRDRVHRWFEEGEEFFDIHISQYCGVSWRASGTKR